MIDIDEIMDMLDWNNSVDEQIKGVELAKKIKHLSVLFQPIENKSIWENCARVIISKSNQELELYLISMFEWLKDMNWPGAYLIYDRLKSMPEQLITFAYSICLSMAEQTCDYSWKQVLKDFKKE